MTRFLLTAAAACLAFALLPACGGGGGGGGTVEPESVLLLSTEARYAGSRNVITTNFAMGLSHMDPMTGDMFYSLFDDGTTWTAADVGTTRTIRRGDGPDFGTFAEQVANGVDEGLHFRWYMNGPESGSTAANESARWAGGFDGTLVPDADGYVITRVELELTQANLDSPAHDPNGDGIYTVYEILWDVRVYGYAQP